MGSNASKSSSQLVALASSDDSKVFPSNDIENDINNKNNTVIVVNGPGGPFKHGISDVSSAACTEDTVSLISSVSSENLSLAPSFTARQWDGIKRYSDFIQEGLKAQNRDASDVAILFESPSVAEDSCFRNTQVFKFHEYPVSSTFYKRMLGPCRYASVTGDAFPVYLNSGAPPAGLVEHWTENLPGFKPPKFVDSISDDTMVYTYLPTENIPKHLNDPHIHYHLCGKDALPLMTDKTPKLLSNTSVQRPCIAKTTHSMASKGIFVIRNDQDEQEFQDYLVESGNPSFIVTEFVDIDRNAACHFFLHANGDITWFGSNENKRDPVTGNWSMDSYLIGPDQDMLRDIQLPYVKDVAKYCHSLGFWGFMGIDVLFDKSGKGYLVDLNPRVTGSCPSLMVLQLLKQQHGFDYGLFRRNGDCYYQGTTDQLLEAVKEHNDTHRGHSQIVLFSMSPCAYPDWSTVNIGVYGHSVEDCRQFLNKFCHPRPQ